MLEDKYQIGVRKSGARFDQIQQLKIRNGGLPRTGFSGEGSLKV